MKLSQKVKVMQPYLFNANKNKTKWT